MYEVTSSSPLHPGPLWTRVAVAVPVRVSSMSQIYLFEKLVLDKNYLKAHNWI